MFSSFRTAALVVLSAAPGLALAQGSTTPAAPQPVYQSAFEGYRSFTDEPVRSWRETNDTVGRIGGWRVYAKEAAGADGGGHAGHGGAAATQGQTPPRAGTANTDKPFGQTEATNPPVSAPRPTPATPPASQPAAPAGHQQHH